MSDDDYRTIMYQMSNLLIYSIEYTDENSKKCRLQANNENVHFMKILLKNLNFKDFRIQSNLLVFKYDNDSFYYGVKTNLDALNEIHETLTIFGKKYYSESDVVQYIESSQTSSKQMNYNEKNKDWECNACTLINEPSRLECDACGTKKENITERLDYTPPTEYITASALHFTPTRRPVNNMIHKRVRENVKKKDINHNQQKLSEYLAFHMQNLIENTQAFECDICLNEQVEPHEGAILKDCLHAFCKECLREHILHSNDAAVKCPFGKDYICEAVLQDREIRALLSEEEYNRFLLMSLKIGEARIENTFHCKTPDCIGFCIFDDESDDSQWFECPVCEQTNCLRCDAVHKDKTCAEYREDLKIKEINDKDLEEGKKYIENMVKNGEAMHCPGCKVLVFKADGCDWIQCPVCKMEICWATKGPRWGPKGHGDTSGGCKCNTNGRLCHPNCGNCH